MKGYRKIKIFKFSEFESYEDCQESANDYVRDIYNDFHRFPEMKFTPDYIVIICPDLNLIFKKIPVTTKEQRQTRD